MRKNLFILSFLISFSCNAATLNLSFVKDEMMVTGNRYFSQNDGTALALGDVIRVGHFLTPLEILQTSNDLNLLMSQFVSLAENEIDAGSITQFQPVTPSDPDGALAVNLSDGSMVGQINGFSNARIPEGSPLYIWGFNNPDLLQASEWGIYTANEWTMPNDGNFFSRNLNGADNIMALRGNVYSDRLGLSIIPEPSTPVLLALFGMALFLRRNRKQNK